MSTRGLYAIAVLLLVVLAASVVMIGRPVPVEAHVAHVPVRYTWRPPVETVPPILTDPTLNTPTPTPTETDATLVTPTDATMDTPTPGPEGVPDV